MTLSKGCTLIIWNSEILTRSMLARTSIISWMVSGGNFVYSMRYAVTSLSGFQYVWSFSNSMTWSSGLIGVIVVVSAVSVYCVFCGAS